MTSGQGASHGAIGSDGINSNAMKISYDAEVDVLSITFLDTTVTTKYLDKGIAADYGPEGQLAGLEILVASKRLGGISTLQQIVIEGMGLMVG